MPIGPYKNFKICQKEVAKKGIKNTGAYCGAIEAKIRKVKYMPNRDGTGPCGLGPRTGKGRGPCKKK
jgi:hypothetical protein